MAHILTPTFRVSFPNVFKPKLNNLSNKMEFSLVALFAKGENLKSLADELLRVAKEEFGEAAVIKKNEKGLYEVRNGKTVITLKNWPLRDQAEREKDGVMPSGYTKGAVFLNLKSKNKVGIVDQNNQDIIEESELYAGCYARAALTCYYYDQMGNKGFSFGLQALQKVKEGEAFGNRIKAQDAFEPIADSEVADNSAADLFSN